MKRIPKDKPQKDKPITKIGSNSFESSDNRYKKKWPDKRQLAEL